jgi:hypothetical protein
MRELSIWSTRHGTRGELGVFQTAAELRDAGVTDTVHGVAVGTDLLALLRLQPSDSYDRIVIAGHGGTTWIIDDEHGVTSARPRHRDQVCVVDVGRELARVLRGDSPLVSLAACLCSRSPTWLLRRLVRLGRLGEIGSDWGERSYRPGGLQSFSAWLRDSIVGHGQPVRVRGHRASGHATALALLAEHSGHVGEPCDTLYGRSLGVLGVEPVLRVQRWWTAHVTGLLAQRWLLGDDHIEERIRELWRAR